MVCPIIGEDDIRGAGRGDRLHRRAFELDHRRARRCAIDEDRQPVHEGGGRADEHGIGVNPSGVSGLRIGGIGHGEASKAAIQAPGIALEIGLRSPQDLVGGVVNIDVVKLLDVFRRCPAGRGDGDIGGMDAEFLNPRAAAGRGEGHDDILAASDGIGLDRGDASDTCAADAFHDP